MLYGEFLRRVLVIIHIWGVFVITTMYGGPRNLPNNLALIF